MKALLNITVDKDSADMVEMWIKENTIRYSFNNTYDSDSFMLKESGEVFLLASSRGLYVYEFYIRQYKDQCMLIGKIYLLKFYRYIFILALIIGNIVLIILSNNNEVISIIVPIISLTISIFLIDFINSYHNRFFEKKICKFFEPITVK